MIWHKKYLQLTGMKIEMAKVASLYRESNLSAKSVSLIINLAI